MARKKISQLESATDVTASDFIQIVDVEDSDMAVSGTNKKATAQLLANELGKLTNVTATGSTTARSLANRFADTVNVKDFGAVNDCTGQGIGTDVIPAILAAVNYAVTLGNGTKVILPQGRYRASTSAVLNLAGRSFIEFDFQGSITPDASAMTVLTIENGKFFTLSSSVNEGGIFNGWLAPQPYGPCDYSTTRDAGSSGGQEMFLIRGVSNFTTNLCASAYAGRLLRTDERSSLSHPRTLAIKGSIKTERSSDLSKPRTAQCLWADGGTVDPNYGNWGSLESIVCDFDFYGPVWKRLNDIEIGMMDCAFHGAGPTFLGCIVVTGNTWYIGDTDGGTGSRHIQFVSSGGINCASIDVKFMRFLKQGPGLWMENVQHSTFSADAMGTGHGDVVTLINCIDVQGRISSYGSGSRLVSISGSSSDKIHLEAINQGASLSSDNILIDSAVTGVINIRPSLYGTSSSASLIKVNGQAVVNIYDAYLTGSAGFIFDISSTTNNVSVHSGVILTEPTAVYKNSIKPFFISNVIGVNDPAVSSNIRSNYGGLDVGSGGAFLVGVATGGCQQFSPMAQVKGLLVNSAGTELQGDIALQIRPNGVAGQSLINAITASNTTTNGEMTAIIIARVSGEYVAKRVKFGNSGTGPGGVGCALYIDN